MCVVKLKIQELGRETLEWLLKEESWQVSQEEGPGGERHQRFSGRLMGLNTRSSSGGGAEVPEFLVASGGVEMEP